jgi:hypothetical protein
VWYLGNVWSGIAMDCSIKRQVDPERAGRGTYYGARTYARLPHMPLILILVILLLLFGGGGYYMGPGVGYYGGGGLSIVLLIIILFLLFGRGRRI